MDDVGQARRFWHSVAAAIAALARQAGCSIDQCPLPEIREAGQELKSGSSLA
jgi:hypothetical protein